MSQDLESEFDKTIRQLNVKLREAATAMKEANKLRDKAGLKSMILTSWLRDDVYNTLKDEEDADDEVYKLESIYEKIDVSGLEKELSIAGWSTSSSYC